ncbi:hypothetical protein RB595_003410 [Gaeumannomyces hyphopodioides]
MADRKLGEDQPIGVPTTDYSKIESKTSSIPNPTANLGEDRPIGIPTADYGKDDTKPKAFDARGAVGKQFTADEGVIGGTANKIGGPLAKDGFVGKQFTAEGSIGGTIQSAVGGSKKSS